MACRIRSMSSTDLNCEPLEIDEEHVLLGVVAEALLERQRQHAVAQAHRLGKEDPLVHQPRRPVHDGREIHLREDVPVQVDAGRDLDQLETLVAERKHAALGDVEHRLLARCGVLAAERAVLDLADELARRAVAADMEPAALRSPCRRRRR